MRLWSSAQIRMLSRGFNKSNSRMLVRVDVQTFGSRPDRRLHASKQLAQSVDQTLPSKPGTRRTARMLRSCRGAYQKANKWGVVRARHNGPAGLGRSRHHIAWNSILSPSILIYDIIVRLRSPLVVLVAADLDLDLTTSPLDRGYEQAILRTSGALPQSCKNFTPEEYWWQVLVCSPGLNDFSAMAASAKQRL